MSKKQKVQNKTQIQELTAMTFTAANLGGVGRPMRRGTFIPKPPSVEEMGRAENERSFREQTRKINEAQKKIMEAQNRLSESETPGRDSEVHRVSEVPDRAGWLEKVRRTSIAVRTKGHVNQEIEIPDNFNGVFSIKYAPDGTTFACAYGAGAIQVRYADTGDLKITLRSAIEHGFPIMCVRYIPNRKDIFFAAGACGNLYACNAKTGEFSKYKEEVNNEINSLDINLDGEYMVSGGKDATIRLYDILTAKYISKYSREPDDSTDDNLTKFHYMRIFAVKFHPDEQFCFISGGWDDTVKIWDVRVKDGCVTTLKGPHICGDALDIKQRTLLTGTWAVKGSIQTWDLNTNSLLDTIVPVNRPASIDGEYLYCVQFMSGDPSGDLILAGGSGTGAVEIISLQNKRVIGSFRVTKPVHTLDTFDNSIIFGGMENKIRLADFVA